MILSLFFMIEGFETSLQLLASGHQKAAIVVFIIAGVFCLCATSSYYNIKNEVKKLKNEVKELKDKGI